MGKFMLLYKGPATEPADMQPEAAQAVMAKWAEWMQGVGSALADMGAPMNKTGVSVVDDGSTGTTEQLNGYSILEASDLKAATALCAGHPFLSDSDGKFSIEVYELLPVPGM